MPFYKDVFHQLRQQLQPLYDAGEATAITREMMEAATGISYAKSLITDAMLDAETYHLIERMSEELQTGKPLQYVLGYAWFIDRKFIVNGHVLIPRPETEELVQWIIDDHQENQNAPSILDIGTGSGCIPISLKLALKAASVTSCDISKGALETASLNAEALSAKIELKEMNFLDKKAQTNLPTYNIIVSNPPYIPLKDKATMHINVLNYEPTNALFVPNDDALIFYREIALFGRSHLAKNGTIYCELHKDYAQQTVTLFKETGYNQVELKKDINGHFRMLKAALW